MFKEREWVSICNDFVTLGDLTMIERKQLEKLPKTTETVWMYYITIESIFLTFNMKKLHKFSWTALDPHLIRTSSRVLEMLRRAKSQLFLSKHLNMAGSILKMWLVISKDTLWSAKSKLIFWSHMKTEILSFKMTPWF